MSEFLFYIVIFLTNIIQGITGFAGTILAMPPSMVLVGYDVAKPILNVLGILAGVLIMAANLKEVQWRELKKILPLMFLGILAGVFIKPVFAGNMKLVYVTFGIFVLLLAFDGLVLKNRPLLRKKETSGKAGRALDDGLLLLAGIIHGLFVSGGPLLIAYAGKKIADRQKFRATVSSVWVVLNTIILIDDVRFGYWSPPLVGKLLISLPFFLLGIAVGSYLSKRMSKKFFTILTYLLMAFSGVMLLLK